MAFQDVFALDGSQHQHNILQKRVPFRRLATPSNHSNRNDVLIQNKSPIYVSYLMRGMSGSTGWQWNQPICMVGHF
jgi:hypothetical protein